MAILAEDLEARVRATGASEAARDLGKVGTAAERTGRQVDTAGTKAQSGGKRFSAAGMLVKAAAGSMAVSLGGKVVMGASDLNEQLSKTGVVFGPQADLVTNKADQMAKRFGIAKTTFLEAAGGIGLVGKASGLSQKEAAKLSNQMGVLAADAQSFYNVPITEALDAMKSGLVGEAEPMRRFGVLLSDAAVQAESARLGLSKMGDELTEGQKVQARSSLIIKGMSDASGDLARTQGSVANRVKELQGRLTNYAADLGTKVLPLAERFLEWAIDVGPKVADFGAALGRDLMPHLKTTVGVLGEVLGVAKDLGGTLMGLPDPIKDTGIQVALMALAVGKAVPLIQSANASLATMRTRMNEAGKAAVFGRGLAGAAGIGAIALGQLADQGTETGRALSDLANIGGGALLGFAVGGPVGAAVGGLSGLLMSLATQNDVSADSFDTNRAAARSFKDTLDQTTGAITRATRAQALKSLQDTVALEAGGKLGIATRDLIGATLNEKGARERVLEAIARGNKVRDQEKLRLKNGALAHQALEQALFGVKGMTEGTADAFRKQHRELRQQIQDTKTWRQALQGIPKRVRTVLENKNYDLTRRQVLDLVKKYDLTPKQKTTLFKALGIEKVSKDAKRASDDLDALGRKRPSPKADLDDREARRKAADLRGLLLGPLTRTTARPKATLNDAASGGIATVAQRLAALNGDRATVYVDKVIAGAKTIAGNLGFDQGGYTGNGARLEPAGIVHRGEFVHDAETTRRARPLLEAIHAAKGRLFGFAEGGAADGKSKAAKAIFGASTIKDLANGVKGGVDASALVKSLANIIRRNASGARERALLDRLDRLRRVGERQERIQARLAAAQQRLTDLTEQRTQFREDVRAGIASQATVLNAGNSAAAIQTSLGVQADKAKAFARDLNRMKSMGYSAAVIQQVAAAGIEGGAHVAAALVAGTSGNVQGINASFKAITDQAGTTSRELASQMFDAGVNGARGLVKGLKAKRAEIQDTLRGIAQDLGQTLRKALGIKSPSKVTEQIGAYVGQGLKVGLDGQRRQVRQKARELGLEAVSGVSWGATARGGLRGPQIGAQRLTPAAVGQGPSASQVVFQFTTHNPVAEPQSRTTNKALDRVASLGLV